MQLESPSHNRHALSRHVWLQHQATSQFLSLSYNTILPLLFNIWSTLSFCFLFHDSLWGMLSYFYWHNSLFLFSFVFLKNHLITKQQMSKLPKALFLCIYHKFCQMKFSSISCFSKVNFYIFFSCLFTQFLNSLVRNFSTFTWKRKIVNAHIIDYQSLVTTSPGN